MNDAEIRAAALEVVHAETTPPLEACFGVDPVVPIRAWLSAKAVACFWLAGHPADDAEPITAEWVQSLRFVADTTDEFEGGPQTVWVFRDEHGDVVLTLDPPEPPPFPVEWNAYLGPVEDYNPWPRTLLTRGDLRLLLAALGVPR